MTAAADLGTATLNSFVRAAGFLLLLAWSVLAFMFAFAAMIVVAVMVLGAAIAIRLMPARRDGAGARILEARETPAGWVVEAVARPKS